jgi:hypothetical protein
MHPILPPKRWQPDGPEFDSLRYHLWYKKLLVRKCQIPALYQAWLLVQHGQPQWKAASEFKIDERELRDFEKYMLKEPLDRPPGCQRVIDAAYAMYEDSGLKHAFSKCVERSAGYYGLNPRALRELWEVDPCLYPTGYNK